MLTMLLAMMTMAAPPTVSEPAPIGPLPSARQLQWHELEYYAFVHFGPNTFTDREWGEGREDPAVFDPTALDCRQWAAVARDAGMKGIIITAKHHDGFCNWPSAYTEHSVASSPWRGGGGDLLRELSDACAEFDLKFGVYLSPWDRNHPDYGDSPRYNAFFRRQLEEVLTGYGPVFEVWFDGACGEGPSGRRQVYDWPAFIDVVRRCQPDAVIFSDAGPDVRWVGNERGYANETNWSLLKRDGFEPGTPRYRELTSGHADGTHWLPAECDVSIRPGWFYHPGQDEAVKSVDELADIYYGSVGRNGALLLNLPVDRRGLVHENDVRALIALRRLLDATFDEDLARGRAATATNVRGDDQRFGPLRAIDGRRDTFWATDDGVTAASLEVDLGAPTLVNRVVIREHVRLGQRVEAFSVDAWRDGAWSRIVEGTTIGVKRIVRVPAVETTKIRLNVERARGCPTISTFALHLAPPRVAIDAPADAFLGAMPIRLTADLPDAVVHYTLDGSEPTRASPRADGPVTLTASATVKAVAFRGDDASLAPAVRSFRGYRHRDLRHPTLFIRAPDPGLRYRYFEGTWQSLDDLPGAEPAAEGVVASFDPAARRRDEHFALEFRGFVEVPEDGIYTFRLASDDGSRLLIGEDTVVDNDGLHRMIEKNGVVGLQAGHHPITVTWFNATGGLGLEVSIEGPGMPRAPVGPGIVFR